MGSDWWCAMGRRAPRRAVATAFSPCSVIGWILGRSCCSTMRSAPPRPMSWNAGERSARWRCSTSAPRGADTPSSPSRAGALLSQSSPGGPRWMLQRSCPSDWAERIARCNGGLFHTPLGLTTADYAGTPVYAQLLDGTTLLAVAAGVWRRCRLSIRPRHVYFPTLPAVRASPVRVDAVRLLAAALAERGAAE